MIRTTFIAGITPTPFIGMLHSKEESGISVSIPLFQNYSYGLRWPLPFMVFTVTTDEEVESIKRLENQIKDELNIKQVVISRRSL